MIMVHVMRGTGEKKFRLVFCKSHYATMMHAAMKDISGITRWEKYQELNTAWYFH